MVPKEPVTSGKLWPWNVASLWCFGKNQGTLCQQYITKVIQLKGLHNGTVPSAAQLELGGSGHKVCANFHVLSRWA